MMGPAWNPLLQRQPGNSKYPFKFYFPHSVLSNLLPYASSHDLSHGETGKI